MEIDACIRFGRKTYQESIGVEVVLGEGGEKDCVGFVLNDELLFTVRVMDLLYVLEEKGIC